jgi:hypothetical protein
VRLESFNADAYVSLLFCTARDATDAQAEYPTKNRLGLSQFPSLTLLPMDSIENEGDCIGAVEDSWWSPKFPQPSDYRSLPETSKWVCRLERASVDGPMCLKVSTAGKSHFYPAFYTSIFMLLDLHHLSSLAEGIRLPAGSSETPRHMKNVHFLDQMRLQILRGAQDPGNPKDDPFLKRWVLRLIHGIPNSKTLREREPAKVAQIYSNFQNGCRWKTGGDSPPSENSNLPKISPA